MSLPVAKGWPFQLTEKMCSNLVAVAGCAVGGNGLKLTSQVGMGRLRRWRWWMEMVLVMVVEGSVYEPWPRW